MASCSFRSFKAAGIDPNDPQAFEKLRETPQFQEMMRNRDGERGEGRGAALTPRRKSNSVRR